MAWRVYREAYDAILRARVGEVKLGIDENAPAARANAPAAEWSGELATGANLTASRA